MFDLYGVEDEIQRALEKEVPLKSGGYLVIDQTEAMTTVDVNTGSFLGQRNLEETVYRTNLEAAQAVARQLRLRNLGGIIIIDFIDMHDAEHRRQVLRTLEKSLARDHAKTTVYDFSPLGLVEMTRKRTVEALERQLCEPCHECGGRGMLKTAGDRDLRDLPRDHPRGAPVRGRAAAGDRLAEGRRAHHRRGIGGGRRTGGIPRQVDPLPGRRRSTCRNSSMSCCCDRALRRARLMPTPLRRRLRLARRGLWYAVAVVLVLMALIAGVVSQLLPLAERHPDRVAAWLSERAGRPVAFDRGRDAMDAARPAAAARRPARRRRRQGVRRSAMRRC